MAPDAEGRFREAEELPPVRGTPRWALAICAAMVVFIAVLIWLLSGGPQEPNVAGPDARPIAIARDGYVGSHTCRECHPHEHDTWHDSYHRTMTQVAGPESVVADFNGVRLERFGREYRMSRDREHFWAESSEVGLGEQAFASSARRNIVLCTGSHHMQVYWTPTGRGRELAVLPFAWLIREQKWIPRQSAFLELPSAEDEYEPGRWNRSCIACHTTHGDRGFHSPAAPQSTVAEFGISCEACHGPGEDHIRRHRGDAESPGDDSIVHPLRLSHVRAAEVCGQCHMAWHAEAAEAALTFRPGDDLQSLRRVVKKPSQFWPDGMVRVLGREFNGSSSRRAFSEESCPV
jgi:hypothetical protein